MKWAVHMLARFVFWFGLFTFILCWGFALIHPALVALVVCCVASIVCGWFRFCDRYEQIQRLRNAPHLGDIRAVINAGPYREDGQWPSTTSKIQTPIER